QLDPNPASEAGAGERRTEEPRPVERRAPDRLGNAAMDVVDDGVPNGALRVRRAFSLQPVSGDPAPLERSLDGLSVILERDREEVHPRIEVAGPIAVVRESRQREMLPNGERVTFGDDR